MIQLVAKHGLIKKLDFLGGKRAKEKVTGKKYKNAYKKHKDKL